MINKFILSLLILVTCDTLNPYIWCEEVLYSLCRAFESQSSDEEDCEDKIWESGGDVDSLKKERWHVYI